LSSASPIENFELNALFHADELDFVGTGIDLGVNDYSKTKAKRRRGPIFSTISPAPSLGLERGSMKVQQASLAPRPKTGLI